MDESKEILSYERPLADPERNHPLALVLLSFALAFIFAVQFVVVFTWTLPPTDGAYGQAPFQDPLVLPIMSMGAAIAGAIVCVPTCLMLRRREWITSTCIVFAVVSAEIWIVTPLASRFAFVGSIVAYFVGLVLARRFAERL